MGKIQANEEVETSNVPKTVTSYPPKNLKMQQHPSVEHAEIVEPVISFPPNSMIGSNSTVEPVTSYLPNSQVGRPPYVGKPWSTGLFDFHLNQTNGISIYPYTTIRFHKLNPNFDIYSGSSLM